MNCRFINGVDGITIIMLALQLAIITQTGVIKRERERERERESERKRERERWRQQEIPSDVQIHRWD